MNKCNLVILTFVITGIYDVLLQTLSKHYELLPKIFQEFFSFGKLLQPYFKHHTPLSAALIAAFVGATAQIIIINIVTFPTKLTNIIYILWFLLVSFIISVLYGYGMIYSNLFPYLNKYYYDKLNSSQIIVQNGISGIIVQITILVLLLWNKK
jgi:hypothetical protein